eukprot:7899163-Alexandrium_andersonii.AAC.1
MVRARLTLPTSAQSLGRPRTAQMTSNGCPAMSLARRKLWGRARDGRADWRRSLLRWGLDLRGRPVVRSG